MHLESAYRILHIKYLKFYFKKDELFLQNICKCEKNNVTFASRFAGSGKYNEKVNSREHFGKCKSLIMRVEKKKINFFQKKLGLEKKVITFASRFAGSGKTEETEKFFQKK